VSPTAKVRGVVHLISDLCKGCGICVWICPRNVLEMSDKVNRFGWRIPRVKNGCVGCKLCETYCPDLAIWVEVVRNGT